MARNNQGINVLSNLDPVPTDLQGGYAGGDSTAAAIAQVGGVAAAAQEAAAGAVTSAAAAAYTVTDRLATWRTSASASLKLAVVGDSFWVSSWLTEFAKALPTNVGATLNGSTVKPGSGTPSTGGPTVIDDFGSDGALNGRTPTKGPAWVAGTGWTTSAGTAKASALNEGAALDAGVNDDLDAVFDLSIVTNGTGSSQSWRLFAGAAAPSGTTAYLNNGIWSALTISGSGGLTLSLWKTVAGTSTALVSSVPVTGLATSATAQTVRATLTLRAGQASITLTNSAGTTTYATGSAAVASADKAGTRVGVLSTSASTPGLALDAINAGTPLIPGSGGTMLDVTTHSSASGLPAALDLALTSTEALATAVRTARPGLPVQVIAGTDVTARTMPGVLAQRIAALEAAPAAVTVSAVEQLRTLKAFSSGVLDVVVISDSTANDSNDWVRLWTQKWGPTLASSVRRTYRSWDATNNVWRAETVDNAGSAPSAGVIVDDTFTRTGEVVGSTPDTGPAWQGSATPGWTADGALATLSGSAQKTLVQNLASKDQTVRITLSLITTKQAAAQLMRVYAGATNTALGAGVWVSLSVDTNGTTTATLYKTISGTSTVIASGVTVAGVTKDSATPQPVVVEVKTSIQQASAKITAGGQTTTLTGTITEADVNTLGTFGGVLGVPSASYPYAYRIDTVRMQTPAVDNPVLPPTLAVHNGAIAGASLSAFDAAKRAQMLTGITPDLLIFSTGHNHGAQTPSAFTAEVGAWLAAWASEHPDCTVLVVSQNPQVSPSTGIVAHRDRQAALRVWAKARGIDYLPVYEAFAAQSGGGASLIGADGVHPTTPPSGITGAYGSVLWADTVTAAL